MKAKKRPQPKRPANTARPPEFNQALAQAQAGKFEEALALFRKSNLRQPHADSLVNIGYCLRRLGRDPEARDVYGKALAMDAKNVDALSNLAASLVDAGEFERAEALLLRATALAPDNAGVLVNLFVVAFGQGRFDDAEVLVRQALAVDPQMPFARKYLGDLMLLRGDLYGGFEAFEERFKTHDVALETISACATRPRWNGEDLAGKTLLLATEQGVGDAFIFLRFCAEVRQRGGRVLVTCQAPLKRLLATGNLVDQLVCHGDPMPDFDYHLPLMSLPHILGTTLETLPAKVPYLAADPALVAQWRGRINAAAGSAPLKVGVVWAGSPGFKDDRRRSPRLNVVKPIFETPGVHFFSLQLGEGRADLDGWQAPANFTDLAGEITDYADTAAIMANLDLVVTSCTSAAHLAGALGRPVWVMLGAVPYWLWMRERADSPWYPSARLIRQSKADVWDNVIEEVRAGLSQLVAAQRPTPPKTAWKSMYGITWNITEMHGWGLVGLHTALYLIERGDPPLLLDRPLFQTMRPHCRAAIEPLMPAMERYAKLLAENKDNVIAFTDVDVFQALMNGMHTNTPKLRGRRNIGLIAFENTYFDEGAAERAKDCDFIVTHSRYNRDLLLAAGVKDVRMVWQGVDPAEMITPPRTNRFGKRFVVFSGGKLEYRKAQDVVLEGFRRFHARHPDSVLVTAWHSAWPQEALTMAESPWSKALPVVNKATNRVEVVQWAVANGIPENAIVDLGFLSRPDMTKVFAELDAAVFPNRCEGATNLVAMEAMGCGIPCVIAANTGQLDLTMEEGASFPLLSQTPLDNSKGARTGWCESDPGELAEALETIYTDRAEAARRAKAGRDFVLGHRTWRQFAEHLIAECDAGR